MALQKRVELVQGDYKGDQIPGGRGGGGPPSGRGGGGGAEESPSVGPLLSGRGGVGGFTSITVALPDSNAEEDEGIRSCSAL